MKQIQEKAFAKLNLSLDVTAKRDDGYHELVMLMQTISLADTLTLTRSDSGAVTASCSLRFIPTDDRNLAVKAAKAFLAAIDRTGEGVSIAMDKRIPVGAGMGGGSADAAAVLRALNRHYGALSPAALEGLAASVGSDVPFCVRCGTALATGRGEKLETLPDMPACEVIICKPDFSISTPELFRKLDQCSTRCHPDTAGLVAALETGSLDQICRRMYNVFEDIDDRRMRTVKEIKGHLLDRGALGAVMTGTGSAVFGVFRPGAAPDDAVTVLREEYGFCEKAVCVGRQT